MQEQKGKNTRQNSNENNLSSIEGKNIDNMPFVLKREVYKQLNVYEKKGHWSQKQKLKYAVFLEYYKNRFEIKAKRRFNNIFDIMSIFIKTRNSHQCRSHHQKMQKEKFKIDSIIKNTESKYHPRVYKQLKDRYINEIETLDLDESQNFEKFKDRIQKIEQRKAIQRQIMSNNKRILRSSRRKEKSYEQKIKKMIKRQKRQEQRKNNQKKQQQLLHNRMNELKIKKQEEQVKYQNMADREVQNQNYGFSQQNEQSNALNKQEKVLEQGESRPQFKLIQKIKMLENKKKQHLDLAYIHYNEYIKHVNQVNNIQFEIVKENSMQGILHSY